MNTPTSTRKYTLWRPHSCCIQTTKRRSFDSLTPSSVPRLWFFSSKKSSIFRHIPLYIVASFIKRLSRNLLVAPLEAQVCFLRILKLLITNWWNNRISSERNIFGNNFFFCQIQSEFFAVLPTFVFNFQEPILGLLRNFVIRHPIASQLMHRNVPGIEFFTIYCRKFLFLQKNSILTHSTMKNQTCRKRTLSTARFGKSRLGIF